MSKTISKNATAFTIWSLNVLSSLEKSRAAWICRNVSLPDSEAESLGFSKIICNLDLPPQTSLQSPTRAAPAQHPSAPTSADSRFTRSVDTVTTSKGLQHS